MTNLSGSAQQLHQELWTSFTALLKAYAAATSLALPGNAISITDRASGGLEITTAAKALHIAFHSQSGYGVYSVSPAQQTQTASSGSFQIDEHGRIQLDDPASTGPLEMDAAAEALIARIL
ncbi:MAG: hypothetical protein ACP5M4_07975 [Acidobacteriaceae bacterium]